MDEDKIVIACAANNDYAPYCGTMITSLFHNNASHKIEVNILSSYIDADNREKFESLASKYNQTINIVTVSEEQFYNLPATDAKFTNISVEAYFRLCMPTLFPDYEKVLYLDSDMIVRHDLKELWETDMDGYAIASIRDNKYSIEENLPRLGYPEAESYYNSGVGLYNLSFLRLFMFESKVKEMVEQHKDLIVFHDQDILNYVCHGYFKDISIRWNLLSVFMMEDSHITEDRRSDLETWIQNPGIIHYSARYKPWNKEGFHPYESEFWRYLAISPWQGLKRERRFHGKEAIIVFAKLTIKKILGLLGKKIFRYRRLHLVG